MSWDEFMDHMAGTVMCEDGMNTSVLVDRDPFLIYEPVSA